MYFQKALFKSEEQDKQKAIKAEINQHSENAEYVFEARRNLEFEVEKPKGIMKYQKTNRTGEKMNGENLLRRRGTFIVYFTLSLIHI